MSEHLVAGATAGIVSTLALHPLDLLKVRFQVQDNLKATAQSASIRPHYTSLWHAARTIVQTEGPAALYKGVTPNALGCSVAWGSYFYGYEFFKRKVSQHSTMSAHAKHMVSAIMAGSVTLVLTNPIWVVKTRMILQYENGKGYRNLVHGLVSICKEEGVRGMYKGLAPGLLGTSHGAVQFVVYEEFKRYLNHVQGREANEKLRDVEYIAIAGISKACAATATYPLQVVRSRLQDITATKNMTAATLVKRLWQTEGIFVFYRGLSASILRVLPSTCITFLLYERLSRILKERNDKV
eukprot:m.123798 g.123798  ORF g.123798 m.123798 type:complete len:296 (-) comp14456_c1_seq1:239-1126(-)